MAIVSIWVSFLIFLSNIVESLDLLKGDDYENVSQHDLKTDKCNFVIYKGFR